jgi:hypothetical protein
LHTFKVCKSYYSFNFIIFSITKILKFYSFLPRLRYLRYATLNTLRLRQRLRYLLSIRRVDHTLKILAQQFVWPTAEPDVLDPLLSTYTYAARTNYSLPTPTLQGPTTLYLHPRYKDQLLSTLRLRYRDQLLSTLRLRLAPGMLPAAARLCPRYVLT